MKNRKEALSELLFYRAPLEVLQRQLKAFRWDSEDTLAVVTSAHIQHVIERYMSNELSAEQVEAWANAVEGREDLAYLTAQQELLQDAIHQLANPLLTTPLSPSNAKALLAKLRA